MGTGKSTIGRELALKVGRQFIDTDRLIETWTSKNIKTIFDQDGEKEFRALEVQAAAHVATHHCLVVATGGGLVINSQCVTHLESNGIIICLTATTPMILERVWASDRPLLAVDDPETHIDNLLAERRHIYNQFAQFDTTNKLPIEIVEDILTYLHK